MGLEEEAHRGSLNLANGTRRVPSAQGDYAEFYRRFAAALRGEGPLPVTAAEAVAVTRVLDAARTSEAQGRTIWLEEA